MPTPVPLPLENGEIQRGSTEETPAGAAGVTLAVFYGQLGGLLRSGMPLPTALRSLAQDSGSRRFRAALERAAAAMERGVSAEAAFAQEERELGGMLGRVAGAAAATGKLPVLLSELSAWSLVQDSIRRQLLDALVYPYVVLLLACILSLGVLSIARFWDIDRLMAEMDLDVSTAPLNVALAVTSAILALALIAPAGLALKRLSRNARKLWEMLLIRMPVARAVARPLALSRFCGAAAILMKSGVGYHQAVRAAGQLTGFAPYEDATREAAELLEAGRRPDEAWKTNPLFTGTFRFMLNAAETRGDVPETLAELAELNLHEAEGRGRVLAILAPPACLIFIGLLVSMLLYAVLSPMLKMLEVLTWIGG